MTMATVIAPRPTSGTYDEITRILSGDVGDALASWPSRFTAAPDTTGAYPDAPEHILRDLEHDDLVSYLVAAARAEGETAATGPAEANVRWAKIRDAIAQEVATRLAVATADTDRELF